MDKLKKKNSIKIVLHRCNLLLFITKRYAMRQLVIIMFQASV